MIETCLRRTAAAFVAVAMLSAPVTATAGTSTYTPPGAKKCGGFKHRYGYHVYAQGGATCKLSLRIVKSFIINHARWTKHSIDGTVAGTHYTSRRYPGWRCSEGSGGGGCTKGKRTAGYQNYLLD